MTFAGVDFGTSNSTVGLMVGGKPRLVALEGDRVTLPSAIFFGFGEGGMGRANVSYGRQAIADYIEGEEGRLMRALKSVLGSSLMQNSSLRGRSFSFLEILGMFIAHLKAKLDAEAGDDVQRVVLGRPVQFVDGDKVADKRAQGELEQAARAQGFKDIAFQYEPIAAALDYEQRVRAEELALIVDIGGGTSDFSVVRVSPERAKAADRKVDILANVGVHIGGTDFDKLLSMAQVMPEFGYKTMTADGRKELPASFYFDLATWQRINFLYTKDVTHDLRQVRHAAAEPEKVGRLMKVVEHKLGHWLAGQVEQAKIGLTDAERVGLDLAAVEGGLTLEVTQEGLEEAIGAAVEKVVVTVEQALAQAGAGVQTVFLTGGSTMIPLVKASILALLPGVRVVEGDMFGSVGLGLALDAARKFA
jgi:hypothetical chaperone protein